jgi:hypothetical protein
MRRRNTSALAGEESAFALRATARLRRCTRLEGRGWFSLRSVGSAQSPELRPSGVDTSRRHLGAALAPRFCETNPNSHGAFFSGSVRVIVCYGDGDGFLNRVRLAKTDPISRWLGRIFCASGIVVGFYDDNANGFVCRTGKFVPPFDEGGGTKDTEICSVSEAPALRPYAASSGAKP